MFHVCENMANIAYEIFKKKILLTKTYTSVNIDQVLLNDNRIQSIKIFFYNGRLP